MYSHPLPEPCGISRGGVGVVVVGGGVGGGGSIDIDGNNTALNRSNNNRRIIDKNGACFCADVYSCHP